MRKERLSSFNSSHFVLFCFLSLTDYVKIFLRLKMKSTQQMKNEDFSAPPSYLTIDDELEKRNKHYRQKKTFFLFLLLFWILSLFLYLSLPSFHVGSIRFEGLRNLSEDDVFTMMDVHKKTSFLTFDPKEAEKNLEANSSGLFSEIDVSSNIFSGKVVAEEDFPLGKYQDVSYFSSGRQLDEVLSLLSKTNLDDDRKEEISRTMTEKCSSGSLFDVHVKQGNIGDGFQKKMFSPFRNTASEVLEGFTDVVYKNENFKVMDVLYKDKKNGRVFCFENVLYDKIDKIFNRKVFLNEALNACNRDADALSLQEYVFPEGNSIDVYHFKIEYRQNDTIDIVKQY